MGVVEVRHIEQRVSVREQGDGSLLIDLDANVGPAPEGDHTLEAGPVGNSNRFAELANVLVGDVPSDEQHQDAVLVLARAHAIVRFTTARPQRDARFGFLRDHGLRHYIHAAEWVYEMLPAGLIRNPEGASLAVLSGVGPRLVCA
jgi:hypothetical protein